MRTDGRSPSDPDPQVSIFQHRGGPEMAGLGLDYHSNYGLDIQQRGHTQRRLDQMAHMETTEIKR